MRSFKVNQELKIRSALWHLILRFIFNYLLPAILVTIYKFITILRIIFWDIIIIMLKKNIYLLILFCVFLGFSCTLHNLNKNNFSSFSKVEFNELKKDNSNGFSFDKALIHGTLLNGFRYILLKNSTPENRISMHLNVCAGSMHEADNQQGIAHFLEHMLFNGSTHFKPGELVKYFQSIGMSFGSDANAHTSFFETVYDIFLPLNNENSDNNYKKIEKAFLVLSDFAGGGLLLSSEINKERNIVLCEKQDRDSVSYQTFKKALNFEIPDSRINQRFPIGIEKIIKTADRALLKNYYDTWYTPDNMILVMVGDFNVDIAKKLIKKSFSSMKTRADKKQIIKKKAILKQIIQDKWKPHSAIKAFYHYEPEAGNTDVSIGTVTKLEFKEDTLEDLKKRVLGNIADTILQNRLSKIVRQKNSPFSKAGVFSGTYLRNIFFSSISAESDPDKWENTLEILNKNLCTALKFGFTDQELKRVKADFILKLESNVKKAGTRESTMLAKSIIKKINNKKVFMSPKQRQNILKPFIEHLAIDDVNKAFFQTWSAKHRLIEVTGNALISSGNKTPQNIILKTYEKSKKQKLVKYKQKNIAFFPYLTPSKKIETIKHQKHIKNLDVFTIDFKNNIRLNLKKTDFKKKEIIFRLDFGKGRKAEPVSMPGISLIAQEVINESGLGLLDKDQLKEVLAGKDINIYFKADKGTFTFSGSCGSNEIQTLFKLLHAYLMDPGFRQEIFDLSLERYKQMYHQMLRTHQGMMKIKGEKFLAENDTRFGMPDFNKINKLTLDNIKLWIKPFFENKEIEISIVGDFDTQKIINNASKYIGTLEKRKSQNIITRKQPNFPRDRNLLLNVDTKIDKTIVKIAFKTHDFWDIQKNRRLNILAAIISERLRKKIRENLGASYSSYAYNNSSMEYKDYGVLHIVANVDSKMTSIVIKEIKIIINDLFKNGVKQQELNLALQPVLTHIKDLKKNNEYWLNSVLFDSKNHPEKFNWAENIFQDYKSITKQEVSFLAKKYLKIENSALIIIKTL
ncbi:MAG: hypothetical protein B6I26_00695 [Desulfobacteraceae bacterium 4572_130]|nr:MAG: hypothetical protein B6I26_00695 [Desulfobacteraceae bacterium 4572_130]